jgi:uroporphyrinogen decarboxylase
MTSRERIIAAIEHREPDKVPIDLGSTPSSGISVIGYNNLKKSLGITGGKTLVYDVVQQLAQPEDEILDLFNIDVIDVGRTFNTSDNDWHEIKAADGSTAFYPKWFNPELQKDGTWYAYDQNRELIAKMPQGATFFDQTCYPWEDGYPSDFKQLPEAMNKVLWANLAHSPWDCAGDDDFWERLRANSLKLREESDKALMVVCGCNLFEWGTFLRKIDNFLMDLVLEPEKVEGLLDALMEVHLATLAKVCDAVGDVVDIIRFGDDLGMDSGPFMAPDTYRQLFKPRHTVLCDYVKKNSQMKTFLHSCGSIYRLLPDLIEAGYDVINPVQTNSVEMDPATLKKEFGNDITFWGGGADTRTVLNGKTPQEVKDHVKERLEIFSPGGGFVFNTVHNIMPDVPPENIIAMFEAINEFNKT